MDRFVVRTKVRQELRATHHLEEQGFKVYCPQIPKYNGLNEAVGRQVLFPGYCFVQSSELSIASIRSTPGGAVSLIEGPFKGFKGLFSKRSKDRVEVLLTLLGHQQRILVPSHQVFAD